MKSRNPRARLSLSHLDSAQKSAIVASIQSGEPTRIPRNPASLVGYEKSLRGPIFSGLRNNIPTVNHDMWDDEVHVYAERKERAYTPWGSFIDWNPKVNTATTESLFDDVPPVVEVDSVYDLLRTDFIFIDLHSGTIHAVVHSNDRTALRFYRRYFSLLPAPITEMRTREIVKQSEILHLLLTHDGEPVAWLPLDEMTAFIESDRHSDMSKGEWKFVAKKITFVGTNDGLPNSINPHYVLAYNFRYGTFKEG